MDTFQSLLRAHQARISRGQDQFVRNFGTAEYPQTKQGFQSYFTDNTDLYSLIVSDSENTLRQEAAQLDFALTDENENTLKDAGSEAEAAMARRLRDLRGSLPE